MNTLLKNEWGGELVTCDRHRGEQLRYIFGNLTASATTLPCPTCQDEITRLIHPFRVFQALTSPKLSHTRVHSLSPGSVSIYHYDPTSPTGVMFAASYSTEKFNKMFTELRALGMVRGQHSPLSPTERR